MSYKSKILLLATILFLVVGSFLFVNKYSPLEKFDRDHEEERSEDLHARSQQEFMMLRDPAINRLPEKIYEREQLFSRTLPKRQQFIFYKGTQLHNAQSLSWTERGPNNIGGRTRALGIDVNNSNIIIAGGVSGGIWRSTDDGATWTNTFPGTLLHSVTCLTQDVRSGKTNIWYAGSGELIGNSASETGASFRGDGIFKSTDNGVSWSLLASTSTNLPQSFDKLFDYVWNVAVDPSRSDSDIVYAATYGAIYRSNNGGTSWTAVLGGVTPYSLYTDIQVTSTGIAYAALSSESLKKGIWKSSAGIAWTSITPGTFATTYYRTVIGIAPSNNNVVYFLTNTLNTGKAGDPGYTSGDDYHSLWKYNNAAGVWTNRSSGLPTWSGNVGGYSSQGSYDMLVKVKPNDTNFVIIGGTNLFRSTDGFATTIGITAANWIGGYAVANDVTMYTNQHPDQHAGVFKPGSNIIFYSGNDGGIKKTSDVTASTVSWTSLNNGYNVTQFYSIALAPEANSNIMMGGAQDNGSLLGSSAGASNWTNVESGDGTIVKVAPLADNKIYTAYQLGGVRRRTRSGTFQADFTPTGSANQLFVNPLVLDPNNSSILYYPAGTSTSTSKIWRNSSALTATASTGWTALTNTNVGAGSGYTRQISTLGISTTNSSNVLYFGTNDGLVKRLDNAQSAITTTTPTTITPTSSNTSPSTTLAGGTSTGGYISCIAVDPSNSNNVIVVFSNYNYKSLWYTTNGGTTWTDIEGNLSGASGPSVRWASMFYIGGIQHVFLGTSVGIFSTYLLNDTSTVWTQEAANDIGNVVVSMIDYRSADNTIAVATHGRGIFTTVIATALAVELTEFIGRWNNNTVELFWKTATEQNNARFEIEKLETKNASNSAWLKIGSMGGNGTTNSTHTYSYSDRSNMAEMSTVQYRLKLIDDDGNFSYSNTLELHRNPVPSDFVLEQNYPNPFNPATTINYISAKKDFVTLTVYDAAGKEVAMLVKKEQDAGNYSVQFGGEKYSSGIYFYSLQAGSKKITRKMLLLK